MRWERLGVEPLLDAGAARVRKVRSRALVCRKLLRPPKEAQVLVLPVLALHVCESTAVAAVGIVRRGRAPEPVRGEVPAREKLFAPSALDEAVVKHLLLTGVYSRDGAC